jgi:putative ABC transport system permease protein
LLLQPFSRALAQASIVVKTSGGPASVASAIREAVRAGDPNQAVHTLRGMDEYISESLATHRFGMRLLGFFALTALFLAVLQLYGVMSYSVTQRKREIGIRMALGAERGSVMGLVVGQGLRLAGIGMAIGVLAALLAARLVESQLFGVKPSDPLTISSSVGVMLAAAVVACYLPARRAIQVDPAVTLRMD